MSQDPVQEFLEAAQQSGLLSAVDVATLSHAMHQTGAATRQDVAARLVDQNVLTPFQAEQLLAGHGRECVLAGRYFIRQQLGAGAMGAVYLADDRKLERRVAIKVLPAQSVTDAGAVARFQREAKALAKLSHPNIIQAYDSDQDASRQFLVMEYAEGTNLGELVRAKGCIATTIAADYLYQAALGLASAHEKGLVHRDLKPGNLLLTPHGQVKILDLGLARFLQDQIGDATLTREGTGMGTPDYMAPEQFRDARHVDARSDIYSLGCTLYHLITGRVPFPGTSMSEKYTAHEQQEPPRLQEFCPDVPAGLALIVRRMMAKRPGDRFQSAREVAEALFPHVSGSSQAILHVNATASWHGSQLDISVRRGSPRAIKRRRAAISVCVSITALLLFVIAYPPFFRREPTGAAIVPAGTAESPSPPEPADPNILTVAQDGTGDYKTIGEALKQVTAGKTIRVLDAATYSESLSIDDAERHAGIVLEATQNAIIEMPAGASNALSIDGVSDVTVSGFRFRGNIARPRAIFISVSGQSSGLGLQGLDINSSSDVDGIRFQNVAISETDRPLVVRDCAIRVGRLAIGAYGTQNGACRRIMIRDNRMWGALTGIIMEGTVSAMAITGNLLWECGYVGIQLQDPALDSDVLIANNTVFKTDSGIRLWLTSAIETRPPGEVTLKNNLLFGCSEGDVLSVVDKSGRHEAGDGASLINTWRFANNYRDLLGSKGQWLVPLAPNDHKLEVDVLSRDPTDPNFLRPATDSLPATGGAGGEGGELPTYVGALPPEGVQAWDWAKTWDARYPKMLLTVSKDPKGRGEFRSINEALDKVTRPGMTIRVLDDATYEESVVLDDPSHERLTLEAPQHATFLLSGQARRCVAINGVPQVRLQGFRFRGPNASQFSMFVLLSSDCTGVRLEDLDMEAPRPVHGVSLNGVTVTELQQPVVISRSRFEVEGRGIWTGGIPAAMARGISIRENRLHGCPQGVFIEGAVADVQITGNIIWGSSMAGIQIEDLDVASHGVLVANNSVFQCQSAFRVWDKPPQQVVEHGQVEFRGNLLFDSENGDMLYVLGEGGISGDLARSLADLWRFDSNWRDLKGFASAAVVPLSPNDRRIERLAWLSREPKSPDFMRPPADSPLATAGAGTEDRSLPTYVGAVPPEGVELWDWGKTWIARAGPTEPGPTK